MATKDISGSRLPAVVHRRRWRSCTYSYQPSNISFWQGHSRKASGSHQGLHTTPDPPRFDHIFPEKMSSLLPKKNTGIWSSGALTTVVFPPCPKSASVHLAERAATRVRRSTNRKGGRAGAHQCVHVKFCSSCAAVRRGRHTVFEVAPCSPTGDTRMRGP